MSNYLAHAMKIVFLVCCLRGINNKDMTEPDFYLPCQRSSNRIDPIYVISVSVYLGLWTLQCAPIQRYRVTDIHPSHTKIMPQSYPFV